MSKFTKVIISRKWEAPNITVSVDHEGIIISADFDDFLHNVALEVGNPAMLFSVAALEKKLLEASDEVIRIAKEKTKQVM